MNLKNILSVLGIVIAVMMLCSCHQKIEPDEAGLRRRVAQYYKAYNSSTKRLDFYTETDRKSIKEREQWNREQRKLGNPLAAPPIHGEPDLESADIESIHIDGLKGDVFVRTRIKGIKNTFNAVEHWQYLDDNWYLYLPPR